ncbi:MAG: ACT domain-containing protein [Candidatus Spechtbacteria bacterium]|nr:ACT domain-containing protein [Candidatus Spechtbacteria bacterium]
MAKLKVEDFLNNGEIYVWKEKFAVAKTKSQIQGAFATIVDKNEITTICERSILPAKDIIDVGEDDWRIITFAMLLPMDLVGFIAKISGAIAEEGISILYVSSYSTDHLLVQEKDLEKAIAKLRKLGCRVKEK